MLGYSSGQYTRQSQFGTVPSVFFMDEVRCQGNEASILDCPSYASGGDCGVNDGAGVICSVGKTQNHFKTTVRYFSLKLLAIESQTNFRGDSHWGVKAERGKHLDQQTAPL